MLSSTVTSKGQTTIPGQIRDALSIKPGDQLEYTLQGDRVMFRIRPSAAALSGVLGKGKGKSRPFSQIRKAAAKAAIRRTGGRYE